MSLLPFFVVFFDILGINGIHNMLSPNDHLIVLVFASRYIRFVVPLITGMFLYRPANASGCSQYNSKSVAVIIPTVVSNTPAFERCCRSILANYPRVLLVCTVGAKLELDVKNKIGQLREIFPDITFIVVSTDEANKRRQIVAASRKIDANETPITICADDHVFWKPTFIKGLRGPAFDNTEVGLVGTNKKVIRNKTQLSFSGLGASFTNFIACLYLERDNFRIRSEPYIDGGVFCVSGRTSAIRTEILHNQDYQQGYTNEMFFFGIFGPLNPDDDNYGVRWVLRHGWKIAFQCTPECEIVTPLGESHKFWAQVLR
ncbi:unnamed protein product [Discula destructiva]